MGSVHEYVCMCMFVKQKLHKMRLGTLIYFMPRHAMLCILVMCLRWVEGVRGFYEHAKQLGPSSCMKLGISQVLQQICFLREITLIA